MEIPEWTRLVQERNEARVAEAQAIDERDDAQRERAEIAAQLVKSQILFVQQASDLVLLQQDHNELATKLHQALQHGNLFKAQLLAQAAEVRQSQQVQQQKQVQLQGPDDVTSTDTSINNNVSLILSHAAVHVKFVTLTRRDVEYIWNRVIVPGLLIWCCCC